MEIWFVRHGATKWTLKKKIHGCKNVPLCKTGLKKTNVLAEALSKIVFDKVYSSPLMRAYQTAKMIANQGIKIDKCLAERCFGVYEGVQKPRVSITYSDHIPGGETFHEFSARVSNFLMMVLSKYMPSGRILMVSHGGVFSAMLYHFFSISPDTNIYRISNNGLAVFRIDRNNSIHLIQEGRIILSCNNGNVK